MGKLSTHRYFVPDLAPYDREDFPRAWRARFVFVAESPHVNEVEPDERSARRPLCGMAGKKWWALLSELLEGDANADVSRERLIKLCRAKKISVLNAVQLPLDPKITKKFPAADPGKTLGFSKQSGPSFYKKRLSAPEMKESLRSLRERIESEQLAGARLFCLGNDAEWFVRQALGAEEFERRAVCKIPHPAAWWRRGGYFGRVARELLTETFSGAETSRG